MRVHPNHQGKGFGQKILDYLEKKALELGYTRIRFYTLYSQKVAQKFYENNNYKKYKIGIKHGLKAIFYEKKLQ
ncbi:GNAT family N-acetyltransferase [Candidatus Woesearchaeota archaeon]|nr:GNAT family N-acetyltransferase [Candidatus Woesearchaeota archaeon]